MEQRLELPDPVNHHWEQRSIVISSESDQEQYLKNAWYTKKCTKDIASFLYCNQKLGRSLGMRLHNHWTTSSSYLLHIVNRNSLVLRPPPSFSSFILQAGQMTGNEASMECSLVPGNIMLWHLISHVRTCTRIMFCSRQWQTLHGSWPAYIAYLKIYSWTYVEISCTLSKLTVCLLSSHVKWEWLVATLSKLLSVLILWCSLFLQWSNFTLGWRCICSPCPASTWKEFWATGKNIGSFIYSSSCTKQLSEGYINEFTAAKLVCNSVEKCNLR